MKIQAPPLGIQTNVSVARANVASAKKLKQIIIWIPAQTVCAEATRASKIATKAEFVVQRTQCRWLSAMTRAARFRFANQDLRGPKQP